MRLVVGLLCCLLCANGARYPISPVSLIESPSGGSRKIGVGSQQQRKVHALLPSAIIADAAVLPVRGGNTEAKKEENHESTTFLMVQTVLSVALETVGLLGVIKLGELFGPIITILGIPIFQWCSVVISIYSSATIKIWVKRIISAITDRKLKPNAIIIPRDGVSLSIHIQKSWQWALAGIWWTISKPMQLFAVAKIMKTPSHWPALVVYCTHLSLGDAWKDLFFLGEQQRVGLGAICISTSSAFLATSTKLFWNIAPAAGKLMVPTCGWVLIAASLNLSAYASKKQG